MLLQAEQMTTISLKIVEVVILSENSCQFASYSVCNNRFFLNLRQVMYQMGQQAKTKTDVEDPSGS